jgi:hypothetical protein
VVFFFEGEMDMKTLPYRGMSDDLERRIVYGWFTEDMGYPEIITKGGVREPVLSTTVERFTGVYDSEGKPVYVGDILLSGHTYWQVSDDMSHFSIHSIGVNWGFDMNLDAMGEEFCVIGNQYTHNEFGEPKVSSRETA